jgi:hypothetical protein
MNTEPGDRLATSIKKDMLDWSPNPNQRGKLVRRMRPQGTEALFVAFAMDLNGGMIPLGRMR